MFKKFSSIDTFHANTEKTKENSNKIITALNDLKYLLGSKI